MPLRLLTKPSTSLWTDTIANKKACILSSQNFAPLIASVRVRSILLSPSVASKFWRHGARAPIVGLRSPPCQAQFGLKYLFHLLVRNRMKKHPVQRMKRSERDVFLVILLQGIIMQNDIQRSAQIDDLTDQKQPEHQQNQRSQRSINEGIPC